MLIMMFRRWTSLERIIASLKTVTLFCEIALREFPIVVGRFNLDFVYAQLKSAVMFRVLRVGGPLLEVHEATRVENAVHDTFGHEELRGCTYPTLRSASRYTC
jgi:hypothetical protein